MQMLQEFFSYQENIGAEKIVKQVNLDYVQKIECGWENHLVKMIFSQNGRVKENSRSGQKNEFKIRSKSGERNITRIQKHIIVRQLKGKL